MSGGSTIATSDTRIEAIRLQSSAYGVPLQVGYGVFRCPGNLVWYGGFKAIAHTSTQSAGGKGGGVKTQNTTYTYTASVMMGICEGPITGIASVWKGKQLFTGAATPSQIATAAETYAVPGGGAMTYTVAHAAAYLNCIGVTAPYTYYSDYEGGGSQTVTGAQPLANGTDYVVSAAGVLTVLNATYRGVTLTITYQWASSAITQTALQQLGLTFGHGAVGQSVWSPLSTIAPSQAIGYSGLAYVAGQDYSLGTGAQVENHTFEVQGPMAYSIGTTVPDANPALAAWDLMLNGRYGAGFPAAQLAAVDDWATYCLAANLLMSPLLDTQQQAGQVLTTMAQLTNTGPVWSNGRLKMIPYGDATLTANGATFTPNVTPIYDLSDATGDFTPSASAAPITVVRKTQADAYNAVKLEFCNRANLYNVELAEAKDSANIDAFGLRVAPTVVAHWICDASIARTVAQLLLQRALYIRNTYTFTLAYTKIFLEPMDLVTLTDSALGFNKLPVRITSVEESDTGDLAFEAEDFPLGVAAAAAYATQGAGGYQHDYNADPGAALAPVIFEAPGALATSGLELCVATASANANWGGAEVWVAWDGTNYQRMGIIYGGSRYGKLTGAISGGTLRVLLKSGALASGSATDLAALGTLSYIGGASPEFVAYTTASLTGALAYNLTGLARGAYGTAVAAHSTNDPFVRMDSAVAYSGALDVALVGKTVSVKLLSFNIFGGALQSLGSVSPTTYTITGAYINSNVSTVQIAPKGITDYVETAVTGPVSTEYHSGSPVDLALATVSFGPYPTATVLDVTVFAEGQVGFGGFTGPPGPQANHVTCHLDDTINGTGVTHAQDLPSNATAAVPAGFTFSLTKTIVLPASTSGSATLNALQTYYGGPPTYAAPNGICNWKNIILKAVVRKR